MDPDACKSAGNLQTIPRVSFKLWYRLATMLFVPKSALKRGRRVVAVALAVTLALTAGIATQLVTAPTAQAANASDFNPGNKITDALFFDGNAMSASEVQNFLNSKLAACTINSGIAGRNAGTPVYGSVVASACTKDFTVSTFSRGANSYCQAYTGSSAESAAMILFKVGQACGVSQKALLALIEKEQSLISDSCEPSWVL